MREKVSLLLIVNSQIGGCHMSLECCFEPRPTIGPEKGGGQETWCWHETGTGQVRKIWLIGWGLKFENACAVISCYWIQKKPISGFECTYRSARHAILRKENCVTSHCDCVMSGYLWISRSYENRLFWW